jgi:hypothetical protein
VLNLYATARAIPLEDGQDPRCVLGPPGCVPGNPCLVFGLILGCVPWWWMIQDPRCVLGPLDVFQGILA